MVRIAVFLSSCLFLLSIVGSTTAVSSAQALVIPSIPGAVIGAGACAGRSLLVTSGRWRVRKGEAFTLRGAQPFDDDYKWKYIWSVDNGKIMNGQGTREITLKAGGKRTPGYVNLDGFVSVRLEVESMDGSDCSLSASTSVMIGKIRESNGHPNVTDLHLSSAAVRESCDKRMETLVDVVTTALDPENDLLTFTYLVSAGRIDGDGAKVRWDLSGVPPGQHRVAVGVNDGKGIVGKTMTATVTVRGCED